MACLVQIILQNTHMIVFERHPFHIHGYSFYIVGTGTGNYDAETSPATFNLVNPPLRNTFVVPHEGWIALRFRADNPGTRIIIFLSYITTISINWVRNKTTGKAAKRIAVHEVYNFMCLNGQTGSNSRAQIKNMPLFSNTSPMIRNDLKSVLGISIYMHFCVNLKHAIYTVEAHPPQSKPSLAS